jgi:glycosyltransferase involved in cell wall biosynthesis
VGEETARSRGRIVMLVDNGVHGDSRVQKTARSAADAGWDVTLIGIKGAGAEDSWQIGDAKVRLLPVPMPLNPPPSQVRRSLRRPLAYPPGPVSAYRHQASKARLANLAAKRARLAAEPPGAKRKARGGLLAASKVYVTGRRLWTSLRARELRHLRDAQADPDALVNRASIAFWRRAMGARSWRRLDPGLWDYEIAIGGVVDALKPDIIHANDFRMLGVGVRSAMRLRAKGHDTRIVWDAHESVAGIAGRPQNPRWLPAQIEYVNEYAPYADAVVTVSPSLADLLRDTHRLAETPKVVLNAPPAGGESDGEAAPDIRALCGIGDDTPLLVYCGGVNPRRGLDTVVDALPRLAGVHVAFVTLHPSGRNAASEELAARASAVAVGDRVHLLPYVPHWQVSAFLAPADAGVIPIQHQPNHEIALITKFFEYSHARLPIVVSDVRTMAEAVRRTGQGEVFTAEDVDGFVTAVNAVLADPKRYRAAYDVPGLLDGWTWEAQIDVLDGVYSDLRAKQLAH